MPNDCPFTPGDHVAAYLRDSGGDDQDQSVPQQEIEVRSWCRANNLHLTHIFKDEAKSGTSTVGRDDFWRMVQHFHNGAGERGVVIWRTNRLGRNINDSQYHKADLRRRGFIVHSLKDNIPEGSAGQLIEFALDWKDQVFIEQLSEDVKRGLRQLVQVYGCVPGTPPRGFKRGRLVIGKRRDGSDHIGHRWIPDPEMIPLVQRAFAMRAKGGTIPQIILATGLYKSVNSFTSFFTNRLYIGELIFADITVSDYCEPMIEKKIWDEVQRVGRSRSQPRSDLHHPRRVVSPFILSGLLFCQQCGSPMSGYTIKRWDYYVCSRRKRNHQCTARRIPRDPIESEAMRLIEERLLTLDNLLAIQTHMQNAWHEHSQGNDHARREIEKSLASVQVKIRNITNAITEHGHSKALLDQLSTLETQEGDLRLALEQLAALTRPANYTPPQLTEIASSLRASLADENEKRATVRGLVARIVAKRTDDQILGVLYCNQVIGDVPPQGRAPIDLFYPIELTIRKKTAPLRK